MPALERPAPVRRIGHACPRWFMLWRGRSNRDDFMTSRPFDSRTLQPLAALALLALPGALWGQTQLTTATSGASQFAAISADGSRVVFQSTADLAGDGGNADASNDVFSVDADGGNLVQLSDTGQGAIRPSISGDGGQVVFASNADLTGDNADGNVELFIAAGDGSGLTQLTDSTGPTGIQQARIARDGSRVVFAAGGNLTGDNPDGSLEVFSVAATGGAPVQLSDGPSGSSSQFPAIAPDGSRAVFTSNTNPDGSNPDGNSEIFIVDAAGGETPQQLTDTVTGQALRPSISASGRIVFQSSGNPAGDNADANTELFAMAADGSGLIQLTNSTGGVTGFARIAADSNLAVFQSSVDFTGSNSDNSSEIFLVDTDSASLSQLTDSAAASEQPDISGDGSRVVYQSAGNPSGDNPEGNLEIFALDVDGDGIGGDDDDDVETKDNFVCTFAGSGCSYCEEDSDSNTDDATTGDDTNDDTNDSMDDSGTTESDTTARIDPTLNLLAAVGVFGLIRRRRRRR